MSIGSDGKDEIKRKLRSLKKLEMKIRFGGPCCASNFGSDALKRSGKLHLVWDDFFNTENTGRKARFSINDLSALSREEYKNIIEEYFFNVYFKYYTENGITAPNMYDPEILGWMGLKPDAGMEDIKKRFRELAKRYHPDLGGDDSKFIELMENYNKLME